MHESGGYRADSTSAIFSKWTRFLAGTGIRCLVAESVLVKHQLLILNPSRQRAQNLRAADRFVAGRCFLFVPPARRIRCAIVLKSSALLNLQQAPKKAKARHSLLRTRAKAQPPKDGPESAYRPLSTPSSAIPRGAARESPGKWVWLSVFALIKALSDESWLTFLGHLKDSLWSIDLFHCESTTLRTHWILVVMLTVL